MIRTNAALMLHIPLLLLFIAPGIVCAHGFHTSFAEADYNRETRQLEIALPVGTDDLFEALELHAGRKPSLEKTPAPELDRLIRTYLAETFIVTLSDGKVLTHQWVGRELDRDDPGGGRLWLYFEIAIPSGLSGVCIQHLVLSTTVRDQLNTVRLRDGDREQTMVFISDRSAKRVDLK